MMVTHAPPGYVCPFCLVVEGRPHPSCLTHPSDVVHRGEHAIAFVSSHWWKNNPGHVLVAPTRHIENLYALPDEIACDIMRLSRRVAVAMKSAYRCDGTSLRQHNEPAGNQDVWHFHMHVFPRYNGDELYLTSEYRLVPPAEREPYAKKLRERLSVAE